eukprot:967872-Rhodomonas_salina.2
MAYGARLSPYAKSGTEIARYVPTRPYAKSGTEIAYGAAREAPPPPQTKEEVSTASDVSPYAMSGVGWYQPTRVSAYAMPVTDTAYGGGTRHSG